MLDDIVWFVRVVEQGSFTKAARMGNSTVSRISKRIQLLENQLQTKLLQRSTRCLRLTSTGEIVYKKCRHLDDLVKSVVDKTTNVDAPITGILKVAAPISFGHELITPLLNEFCQQYPKLLLDIRYQNRTVNLFKEDYDVAIICGQPNRTTQIIRKIGDWNEILCASPNYIENNHPLNQLNDLQRHQCIVRSHDNNIESKWYLNGPEGLNSVDVNYNICVNTPQDLKHLALHDQGIIKVARYLVFEELARKKLVHILPDYYDKSGSVYFEIPDNKYIPLKTKIFMDHITKCLRDNFYK